MFTKLSLFISTLVLVLAGAATAVDGTTKPAVQARLDAEAPVSSISDDCDCACDASANGTVSAATDEVEQPINTSYSSEVLDNTDNTVNTVNTNEEMSSPSNVDTGTKPAVQARQRNEQ